MRVLHVYSGNLYGGIEKMLATLARHAEPCTDLRHEFAFAFEGRLGVELKAAGRAVHRLGHVRASQPASVWRARRSLSELLRGSRYDAVICHAPWSQAIFGAAVREARVPLVCWLHDALDGRHWTQRWARLTPPDLAICNSRFTAATLGQLYRHVRAEVLYCPVAPPAEGFSRDERRAVRAELETPDEATVIIQVGRMERLKGGAAHLLALGKLKGLSGWHCWMVGGAQRPHETEYLEELRALAAREGIAERVRFVGERTDVSGLLAAADIYCQPNTGAEGFGLTFIEALYAGLPIVTTALGGACEIVDEACGVLLPPGDVEALASALGSLIEDAARRESLGASGPARARQLCDPQGQIDSLGAALASITRCAQPEGLKGSITRTMRAGVPNLYSGMRHRYYNLRGLKDWLLTRHASPLIGKQAEPYDEVFWETSEQATDWAVFARTIVDFVKPTSILDVGCGSGKLLAALKEQYPALRLSGLDGSSTALAMAQQRGLSVCRLDIVNTSPKDLEQLQKELGTFELVLCLEVAEHFPAWYAGKLLKILTSFGGLIFFSAAHPNQGGTLHVNEQPTQYWINKFQRFGYRLAAIDESLRGELEKLEIAPWYKDNLHVFERGM